MVAIQIEQKLKTKTIMKIKTFINENKGLQLYHTTTF